MLRRLFNFKQNATVEQLLILDTCSRCNAIHLKELEDELALYLEQFHALECDLANEFSETQDLAVYLRLL